MSAKRKTTSTASSSSTKKPKTLDLAGPPSSVSHLSFEQRGTVLEQLLLDHTTSTKTRTLIQHVVEQPDKIAQDGLDACVKALQFKMSGISGAVSRGWYAERQQSKESCYRPDLWDHEREEEDDDESEPDDEGPEVAQALLPCLSLIASLPSDHPTLPSSVSLAATFDLFLYAIQAGFVVEGAPQETKEFADLVDKELLKVIELRVEAEGAKWDPKMVLMKLMRTRDCNGKERPVLCKLSKSMGRVKAMVLVAEEAKKKAFEASLTKEALTKVVKGRKKGAA